MKIKYTKNELANIIKSVRAAEGSDDLPIHNWARAAKVLDLVADERLELLRRAYIELNRVRDFVDIEPYELLDELAEELGDE